ncbi:protein sip5 [Anaeramoeba ignava]|uniref:Protein sip5 n=1 Tax=Anaeramoeba ignava TaxID=1746090 RepID=A0A9Q0LBD9_ANAIG|nr:protein sip5 [Anaeramoeba ignava]
MGNTYSEEQPHHKYYKPTGMYENVSWKISTVKKKVKNKKMAPLYPPQEEKTTEAREECPICMNYFPTINRTNCCDQFICSECYLQISPDNPNWQTKCPFCKQPNLSIIYTGKRSETELEQDEKEEQKVIEAQIKALKEQDKKKLGEIIQDNEERRQQREQEKEQETSQEDIPSIGNERNGNFNHFQSVNQTADINDLLLQEAIRRSMEDSNETQNRVTNNELDLALQFLMNQN